MELYAAVKKYKGGLLIIASACLAWYAFMPYGYLCTFLFLIPLFYAAQNTGIRWCHGLYWGLLFFSLHFLPYLYVFIYKAGGEYRVVAYAFLVMYFSILTMIWFGLATSLAKKMGNMCGWLCATFLYYILVYHLALGIFGVCEGYTIIFPLLPLAHNIHLLYGVALLGERLSLICLFLSAWYVAAWCRHFTMLHLAIAAICLLPFMMGFLLSESSLPDLGSYCFVAPRDGSFTSVSELVYDIRQARENNPTAKIIFMPESTLQFPLNKHKELVHCFQINALYDDACLVLGAQRNSAANRHNSLYIMNQRLITEGYDKQKPILFGEHMYFPWTKCTIGKNLFIKKEKEFTAGPRNKTLSFPNSTLTLTPLICSEFFSKIFFPKGDNESPLLVMVNDSWFDASPHYQELLRLRAVYIAAVWRMPIFYIAHTGGWYINGWGKIFPIAS